MKLFVTGATGAIGSHAVPLLVAAGHSVTAVARTPEKANLLASQGAQPVTVSLFDRDALGKALAGHDAVINLATHIPSSTTKMLLPFAWKENDRIRREGSAALVDAALAAGVSRFVQESFAPMYAANGAEWITEGSPVEPARYNRSTLDAERNAERFGQRGGTFVILRFAALYGADRLFSEMLGMIRKGWSPLPGDPSAYVTSVSQLDAGAAVVAGLSVPSGIYNVAETNPVRRGEWVASLARAAGVREPKPFPRLLALLGGSLTRLLMRSQRISSKKLRSASTWTPRYPNPADAWPDILRQLAER